MHAGDEITPNSDSDKCFEDLNNSSESPTEKQQPEEFGEYLADQLRFNTF